MKVVVLFAVPILLFGQAVPDQDKVISPGAEFDLKPEVKPHGSGSYSRSFFAVTSTGMTAVVINENKVSLTAADLDGRVLHSRTDLASVHAQIYAALPRPDGCMWLLSSGPYGLSQNFAVLSDSGSASPASRMTGMRPSGPTTNFTQMDLYSPAGEHLQAARLLASVAGAETPIAAADHELILRTEVMRGGSESKQTLLHFGNIVAGVFSEQAQVKLVPPVWGGIPLLQSNGDLILIDKASGNRLAINLNTRSGSLLPLTKPASVKAAAADSDYIYLLSDDTLLKTDSAGRILTSYRLHLSRGFAPTALGVTGKLLFLLDRTGHGERFQLAD